MPCLFKDSPCLPQILRSQKYDGCTFYHNTTRALHSIYSTRKAIFLQYLSYAYDSVYANSKDFIIFPFVCLSFRALRVMGKCTSCHRFFLWRIFQAAVGPGTPLSGCAGRHVKRPGTKQCPGSLFSWMRDYKVKMPLTTYLYIGD